MAYNVGEVEVNVLPNASTFNEKLAGQIGPQADRLGKQIGDTLAQQIAQGIRKGLGDFPSDNPAKDPARRKGDEAAGAFGDAFKARVRAALADLPDVKINADSSDVDRALAAVRAEMEGLRDANLGIDLSDTEALAKLDELKARLAEIGASSDSVQVKVDTAAATAELAAFQADLDKIDGETATAKVKVDTSDSYNGISSLTGALATLAPAIVPIAGAALAGAAALGTMAAAGMGAAGVLAIAFSGVSKAVQLLGQQQTQQAAASAASASQAQSQAQAVVSAQRQMQSAQMALGDAQRNAAQQQISDAQAVKSAQAGLADAQRNAANQQISDAQAVAQAQYALATADGQVATATKALADAQQAAERQMESYANRAVDSQLAAKQAALDLQTAQKNYNTTMASATATAQQRAQADIDLQRAQQGLVEANQAATQAQQDNNKAQAEGADNLPVVVSAIKGVEDAQHNQKQAAQTLADAQRKAATDQITAQESISKAAQALATAQQKAANDQITSHESIVRAQQGVAAAADAMAAAQRQSAGATNAALSATDAAIAKLDPTTRAFAEYLRGTWKPIWDQVQHAAAGGLLPGVQAGMDSLMPLMPTFTGIVSALSKAMGDLFAEAGKALQSPFWTNFLDMIRQDAGPLIDHLGHIIGNVVTGFAGIMQAFMPLSMQISGGIDGLSAKFATWGQSLSTSKGFHDFVDFIRAQWPAIKQIVENVGTALEHLVGAGAILSGPTLSLLRTFSGILASLPVPVVVGLVGAFEGFKIFQTINGPFSAFADLLGKFVGKTQGATGIVGGLSSAAGGLAGALPLIGAAASVALAGLTFFTDQTAKHKQQVLDDTNAVKDWYQAIAAGGPGAGQAMDQVVGKQKALADATADMKAKQDALNNAFDENSLPSLQGDYENAKQKVADLTGEFKNAYNQLTPTQKAQVDLAQAIRDTGQDSDATRAASARYQQALAAEKGQTDAVNEAEKTHLQRLQDIANQQIAATNSSLAAQQAQLQFKDSVDQLNAGLKDGTLKGNALKEAQIQLGQSAISAAEAAGKQAADQAKANGVTDTAQASNAAMLQSLKDNEKYLTGPAKDAVDQQIQVLQAAIDATKTVADTTKNMGLDVVKTYNNNVQVVHGATDAQIADLRNLGDTVTKLPNGDVIVSANTDDARRQLDDLILHYKDYQIAIGAPDMGPTNATRGGGFKAATGGVVPGYSPGVDSVHAMLSPGEGILVPEAVRGLGGAAAIQSINSSFTSRVPGFAVGGVVGEFPMHMTGRAGIGAGADASLLSQIANATAAAKLAGAVAGAPGGSVERWRGLVNQVLAMLGQPLAEANGVLNLIQHESGGNPNAINLTDSNAAAGHPSQGLMQTIPGTFYANAGPFANRGITDPLANIYAGVNYALRRYGPAMLMAGGRHNAAGQYIGYDSGGLVPPGYHMLYNGTGGNEVIAPQATFREVVNQMHTDAGGAKSGPAAPLVHVEHQYINDGVDMELALRQAEFRQRASVFG